MFFFSGGDERDQDHRGAEHLRGGADLRPPHRGRRRQAHPHLLKVRRHQPGRREIILTPW